MRPRSRPSAGKLGCTMKRAALISGAALLGFSAWASADKVLNMRPGFGDSVTQGTINGALYQRGDVRAAGSGVVQSFVRVSSNASTVEGYNTSGRPLFYDENNSPSFTRNLQFGQVPTVTIGLTNYKEFLLDINQTNNNPYLSLDNVAIRIGGTGSVTGAFGASHGSEIYNMDVGADGDGRVDLDYSLNSGSGQTDMALYVPVSLFGAATDNTFIYLYSSFGVPFANNDGFEEWAVQTPQTLPVIPLPAAVWMGLALMGTVSGASYVRKRRNRIE